MAIEARESEIRAQLARITANRRFQGASRLRAFLEYVVAQSLAGESHAIKEYAIALQVYDRRPDYDPNVDSIVRVEASRLRSRLKDYYETDGKDDPVIIELPKGSYVPLFRAAAPSAPVVPAIVPPPVEPASTKRLWIPIAAVAVLVLVGVAAAGFYRSWNRPQPAAPTIAIVPFTNLSLDPANDRVVQGIAKDVEAELMRSGRLRVMGTAASELVLDASLRQQGSRFRIVAELMNRRDGSYLWSDAFEEESSDIIQLQADVSRRIASGAESQGLAFAREQNEPNSRRRKALELYRAARGQLQLKQDSFLRHGMESFDRPSLEALDRAIALAGQSVAADPTFAAGFTALATYCQMAGEYDPRMLDKAVSAARRAIEIDPQLGEAHGILGFIDFNYYWKIEEAAAHFRKALDYEPRQLTIFRLYSSSLALLDHFDEALRELKRASVIFPNDVVIETSSMMVLYQAGRYQEMEEQARRSVQSKPEYHLYHWAHGLALEQLGRIPEAVQELETCVRLSPADGRCMPALGHAYGRMQRPKEASAILDQLRNRPRTRRSAPYEIALIQAAMGEEQSAIQSLQTALDEREPGFPFLKTEPRFQALRRHQEVQRMLAQIFTR